MLRLQFVFKSVLILALLSCCSDLLGDVKVHPAFGNDMVIQRDQPIKVWGSSDSSDLITIKFADQEKTTSPDDVGNWVVHFESMPANNQPQAMTIRQGESTLELTNVLVGDVWLCGGQSNMEFSLEKIYQGDVEIASARHSEIRLMTIPNKALPEVARTFEPLNEFNSWTNQYEVKGTWRVCSPETARKFAAIGYVFGRRLYLATGVPIGIIDNSVGGTTVEGWTSRSSLGKIPSAAGLLSDWDSRVAAWDPESDLANRLERWKEDTKRRRERGQTPRPKPEDLKPGPAFDRNNPGASYNAMMACLAGCKIKGIIFHQGYNNALGDARPKLYAKTIQAMIQDWREVFGDAVLPFGIIELCAGADPQTMDDFETRMVDAGPFIREAQFEAYDNLPNMGWACAYDQQVNWYHPQMKMMLAERMARWALATQYGMKNIGHAPGKLVAHRLLQDRIVLSFDRELTVRDGRPIAGMAIAGEDQQFYPGEAVFSVKRKDDRGRDVFDFKSIEVSNPLVERPLAVRYAWARCPLGNLTNRAHHERIIPLPSFRTDSWDWPEAPFGQDQGSHRRKINQMRKTARDAAAERKRKTAKNVMGSIE